MRILCEYAPAGPSFVTEGYRKVFQSLGHEFRYWYSDREAAFDAFGEFEPQIYMGRTYAINRAVAKNIALRPEMKVVFYASAWGPLIDKVPLNKFPIDVVKDEEKKVIEKLKRETGKPDFVWLHCHDKWVERVLGGWQSIGVEPVSLMNAADTFTYFNGQKREALNCDVGFVGGYWPYKARNLDRYILPLCHPDRGLRVKIFGNQPWPVIQYLGVCEDNTTRDLFASATICPNISEPHSTNEEFGGYDCVERPWKALLAGGFVISDFVKSLAEDVFFNNEIPFAKTPKEFFELIDHFLKHPEDRLPYMERGRKTVLAAHTYWHRVSKFFDSLGLHDESERTMSEFSRRA